jgi:hypothetical protein
VLGSADDMPPLDGAVALQPKISFTGRNAI